MKGFGWAWGFEDLGLKVLETFVGLGFRVSGQEKIS